MDFLEIEKLLDPIIILIGGLLSWFGIGSIKKISRDLIKGKEKELNLLLPLVVGSGLKLLSWAPLVAVPWATLIVSILGGSVIAGSAHDKVSSPAIKTIKKVAEYVVDMFGKKKGKRK